MINIPSTFRISLRALRTNKMRSAPTMLGIIIGVGAVITMLAVGTGASEKISEQISSMGSNLLIIFPGSVSAGGLRMGGGTQSTLTWEDAEAMKRELPIVEEAVPTLNGPAQIVYGNQNWSTGVYGTTPGVLLVRAWQLSEGRIFNDQEVKNAAKVCILGQTVVSNLFGEMNPVGQVIRIKKLPFTVIGILAEKGQSIMGQDQDDTIYIPISTAQRKIFGKGGMPDMVRSITVQTRNREDLDPAEKQINELLKQRHHVGPNQEPDFTVRNLTQMMMVAEQSTQIMTLLLGAIASVAMRVGGSGIRNSMLVCVTERTREMGIRLAVGAKSWDIRLQ
ncbi:MAG: ABC transporter permease, partial [Syntrophales bacterium LBB04]|nr:ABC transporter permease [Syntrophales bacterium LBB04]